MRITIEENKRIVERMAKRIKLNVVGGPRSLIRI